MYVYIYSHGQKYRYNDISPHFKFLLSNESLDFSDFLKYKIKRINNAD